MGYTMGYPCYISGKKMGSSPSRARNRKHISSDLMGADPQMMGLIYPLHICSGARRSSEDGKGLVHCDGAGADSPKSTALSPPTPPGASPPRVPSCPQSLPWTMKGMMHDCRESWKGLRVPLMRARRGANSLCTRRGFPGTG